MAQGVQSGAPSAGAFLAAAGLAGTAGWVDAVAWLGLHAFVANMTGTVVLMGIAASDLDWGGAGRQAGTVLGFLGGVVLSRVARRLGWGPAPCYALAAAIVCACMGPAGAGYAGVVLLAVAMGLQNAAGTSFGGVGLNTAFLTGNLQRLGETLADPLADPVKDGARHRFALGLLPSVLLAYSAGAAGGGLAMRHLAQPLLPPALALAAAAGIALRIALARARPGRMRAEPIPADAPPTLPPTIEEAAFEDAAPKDVAPKDVALEQAGPTGAAPAGRTPPR